MHAPSPSLAEPAVLVGIDWADRKHDVALREVGSDEVERLQLPHTPEAITEWVAELLLDFLEKHGDQLRPWVPDDAETRALGRLVEARRKAVDLRTKLIQRLTAELKGYFPQALQWTGTHLGSPLATDFLLKWPTLEAVQRARPVTVRRFYYAHNCRASERVERRIEEIRSAEPLTTNPGIVEPSVLTAHMLARQLQALEPSIRAYEKEIARLFQKHPDAHLFNDLPGAGAALVPRLLAAFGTDRTRYESALDIQKYSGIAPVTKRSGNWCFVHWRQSAPTFLRQTFHEFARHSVLRSTWARAHYEPITTSSGSGGATTTPPSGPSPSSGNEFSSDAGRIGSPIARRSTSTRSSGEAPPSQCGSHTPCETVSRRR